MFEEFEKFEEKTFVGFCTEPEIKFNDKGTAICKFGIPLGGDKKAEKPLWLNCKLYKEAAEAFAECCQKGCLVKVCGKFYQYEYNSNIYTEFLVRDFIKISDPIEKKED